MKIKEKLLIYKKYAYNSGINDFDLLINHTQAKIMIISVIGLNFFER